MLDFIDNQKVDDNGLYTQAIFMRCSQYSHSYIIAQIKTLKI